MDSFYEGSTVVLDITVQDTDPDPSVTDPILVNPTAVTSPQFIVRRNGAYVSTETASASSVGDAAGDGSDGRWSATIQLGAGTSGNWSAQPIWIDPSGPRRNPPHEFTVLSAGDEPS